MDNKQKLEDMAKSLCNNEKIVYAAQLTKYSDLNIRQDRLLVVSEQAVYVIKKTKIQRRIVYDKLEAISVSTISSEFLLHVKDEYDYRFLSYEHRQNIIESILKVYVGVRKLGDSYPVYQVPMINLNKVMTSHINAKMKKMVLPDKEFLNIMNLEKFKDQSSAETRRQTEIRKRTSVLFTAKKKDQQDLCIEDFELLKVLGKGAFGKVFLALKKDNKKLYAIKVLKKQEIIELNQLEHTLAEKLILTHVNHPFLVGLEFAFQTPQKLYFVMEFMRGGELFQHLRAEKAFPEERAKFYACCIVLGLGHLHNKNYIYRDLKLENLLLDENGYAKLADFGLAKFIKEEDKALTFCGTPEYLAPEVILGKGHNRPADWWSLGILIYEMIYGIPPFYSSSVQMMYKKAVTRDVVFKPGIDISDEGKDIIVKLLNKTPEKRLGSLADSLEVLSHPWFSSLNWTQINDKKVKAPFIPNCEGESYLNNFDEDFTKEKPRDSKIAVDMKVIKQFQKEFDEMNFNNTK